MKLAKIKHIINIVTLSVLSLITTASWCCTGIQLKANDGSHVNGRTVEFGITLDVSGVIIPRNYSLKGTLPDGSTGMTYQSKYAVVGGGMFGSTDIADGMNEKGLCVGAFYFSNYAQYAQLTNENRSHALSPTEFSNWILTQFATVDEVKAGLNNAVIVPTTPKGWPLLPPFHYVVYDKSGKSIVIEPINGQLKVYDNPIGVMTNSPTFDWHLTNLSNYINLSPVNVTQKTIDGMTLKQFGQGSGLHGLPGDFTPPSRFIRAAVFTGAAIPSANAQQTVFQIFHILNQFDIPFGTVRDVTNNKVDSEYTMVTTVKDPQNLNYYFKTFADQTIKMISLNAFDLNSNQIKVIPMRGNQTVIDVSKTAN